MIKNSNTENNELNPKKTINEKELEVLKFWGDNKIFEKSIKNPAGKNLNLSGEAEKEEIQSFSFYDGPPFATGMPHNGHILAGTIKDAIPRYHTMQGKTVRRVWGWDCHGLPIENLIEKDLKLNSKKEIEEYGVDKFNQAAADSVLRYESEWKKIIPRLGRWVDMDNCYKTMDWTYTESVWWAWKNLYDKKLAYEGYKIMHICPRCETPLAQSEVGLEYHDITDMTVTAKFELVDQPNTFILAWTTTPWTLPGNTALAVNKNLSYVKICLEEEIKTKDENNTEVIKLENNFYICAEKLAEKVFANKKIISKKSIDIDKIIGQKYKPVFETFNNEKYLSELENAENIWRVWHADFITDESGTGIAHEAPAFGTEDMELAKANNIPVIKHVNMNGSFVSEVNENVPELNGLVVKKKDDSISTDIEIVKWLAHNGKLFSKEKIVHSYPLCWRCKTPLLNYATSSWFVDVPQIKDKLLSENQKVSWVPEHIRDGRFGRWLEGAREWAVSRRRYWGAPLPIWRSVDGVETKVIGSLAEIAQPSKNKYYVMRHGEAKHNVPGQERYDSAGDTENHLTENGIAQVIESAQNVKDKKIDIIICSPFLRTRETAEKVCEVIGFDNAKVIFDDRLREHGMGELNGLSFDDAHKIVFTKLANDLNSNERGLESWNQMKTRSTNLVVELEEKYKDKNILIITHLGIIKSLVNSGLAKSDQEVIREESTPGYRLHTAYVPTAGFKELDWKVLPRDESGMINLHKPYIDNVILKDSRGVDMKIIGDVFDCWFESGSMPYAQLHYPFENVEIFEKNFPADFIAEGMDQTRGWFYSLINLGVGLFDKSPFKNVIVNGTVMAGDGRKMSKSEKNYTDPMLLVEKYGADALRFALADSPVMQGENVLFADSTVEDAYKKVVSKIENVLDFYNLYKLEKEEKLEIKNENKLEQNISNNILDQWIIIRLQEIINTSVDGYENYKLDRAVSGVTNFVDDLSTWYLRRSRDRLKEGDTEALATMKYIFSNFAKCVAPMMPFLAERVYKDVLAKEINQVQSEVQEYVSESVHLTRYPVKKEISSEENIILKEMKDVRDAVTDVLMMRQMANDKKGIPVRQPLLSVTINKNINLDIYSEILKEELNIKEIKIDISLESSILDINITPELKREGDQRELSRIIKDLRKELNLKASDYINLIITDEKLELVDENYKKEMKIVQVETGEIISIKKI